jgi:hypothetical protein
MMVELTDIKVFWDVTGCSQVDSSSEGSNAIRNVSIRDVDLKINLPRRAGTQFRVEINGYKS